MLCSDCSGVVKPIVALDIDGTLGDYHGHFIRFACDYMGVECDHVPPYHGEMPFKEWWCKVFAADERTWQDIKLAYRQGAQKRSMPVYDGATSLAKFVNCLDAEVWITTTRPYLRLDGIDPDTRFWLQLHEIEYFGLMYQDDKYAELAQRVDPHRVAAVLDDLAEQYDAAAELFGHGVPILRQNKYNRATVNARSAVANLSEAEVAIRIRLETWRSSHAK